MKSDGRALTFLVMIGYEQVLCVAALADGWVAAPDTQLVLPETGVCHGPGVADEAVTLTTLPAACCS